MFNLVMSCLARSAYPHWPCQSPVNNAHPGTCTHEVASKRIDGGLANNGGLSHDFVLRYCHVQPETISRQFQDGGSLDLACIPPADLRLLPPSPPSLSHLARARQSPGYQGTHWLLSCLVPRSLLCTPTRYLHSGPKTHGWYLTIRRINSGSLFAPTLTSDSMHRGVGRLTDFDHFNPFGSLYRGSTFPGPPALSPRCHPLSPAPLSSSSPPSYPLYQSALCTPPPSVLLIPAPPALDITSIVPSIYLALRAQ